MNNQNNLIEELSTKSLDLVKDKQIEIEKAVWMVVHEHINGFIPVEYDIREIDEALYLSILSSIKSTID